MQTFRRFHSRYNEAIKSATFSFFVSAEAIHAVNAVLWQPGEQTQNTDHDVQTTIVSVCGRST